MKKYAFTLAEVLITLGIIGVVAAWVILNENMDYLKCKDLSWNGKNKC